MMVIWGVAFFVALAGVSASPELAFPETVNENALGFASSRIVSGWEAEEGQLPFQLSLRMVSPEGVVSSCGGSIIHEEWGLTAAHCTGQRVTLVIRVGTVNLTTPHTIIESTEYYNHPDYNSNLPSVVQPHDIALIKFDRKLEWSKFVQPIRMQSSHHKNNDYSGVVFVASGWGRTWTNGASPENLNWVYMRGTSNLLCFLTFGNSPIIVDSTICAGYYNVTSQSTCQGDSGGPLTVVDIDGKLTQVGVTSFVSATGCHTDIPAGFIRSGHYHEWFKTVTGIDFDWNPEEEITTDEPTTDDPSTDEPSTDEPSTDEPSTDEPSTDEPSTEEPSTEEPSTDEPSTDEPSTDEPSTDEPSTDEPSTDEPTTDKPSEESNSEESNSEDSSTGESSSDESNSNESGTEESNPEESNPDESNPEESNPEESNPEESSPEESNPEESSFIYLRSKKAESN